MLGLSGDKFAESETRDTPSLMGHPGRRSSCLWARISVSIYEWDEEGFALDWYLADEPLHKDLQKYYGDLPVYQKYPALYELGFRLERFPVDQRQRGDRSIFSFIRRDETGKKNLLFVINFTPVARDDLPGRRSESPEPTPLILDSEHGLYKRGEHAFSARSKKSECDGQPYPLVSAAGVRDCNL